MIEGGDLVSIVVVGFAAGVGLVAAFSLLVAEAVRSATARRDARAGAALAHGLVAGVLGALCVGAVVGGVLVMLAG